MTEGTRSADRPGTRLAAAVAALALSCAIAPAAHAIEVRDDGGNGPQLLAAGSALGGRQSWTSSLQISGPGKLTVQAYDLGVASTIIDRLESLSFSVASSTSVFGARAGSGTLTLDISDPGMYFLNLSAAPSTRSRFQLGLVSWCATFEANVSAVPLPASVWLLIAGLAWATGMQRKRWKLGSERGNSRGDTAAGALAH